MEEWGRVLSGPTLVFRPKMLERVAGGEGEPLNSRDTFPRSPLSLRHRCQEMQHVLIHPLCSLSLDVRVPPLVNTRGIPRSASDQDEVPEGGYKEPHRSLTLLSALGHPGGRMSTWQPVLTSASVSQRH